MQRPLYKALAHPHKPAPLLTSASTGTWLAWWSRRPQGAHPRNLQRSGAYARSPTPDITHHSSPIPSAIARLAWSPCSSSASLVPPHTYRIGAARISLPKHILAERRSSAHGLPLLVLPRELPPRGFRQWGRRWHPVYLHFPVLDRWWGVWGLPRCSASRGWRAASDGSRVLAWHLSQYRDLGRRARSTLTGRRGDGTPPPLREPRKICHSVLVRGTREPRCIHTVPI